MHQTLDLAIARKYVEEHSYEQATDDQPNPYSWSVAVSE